MRLLICGDRNWQNALSIMREVVSLPERPEVIIHGAARGADSLAGDVADALDIPLYVFPADWDTFGRRAGPVRNQRMLDEGKPDLVIAFHANLADSKGTKDMVNRATKAGIPVRVVTT